MGDPNQDDGADQKGANLPLSIASYDSAYIEFLHEAVDGFISADQVIGGIVRINDPHTGPIRNVRGTNTLDQPMVEMGATMTLHVNALQMTNVDAHTDMVINFAQQMIAVQATQFFKSLGEVSVAAGTSVENVAGGVPTIEQIRDLFRKMEFTFDEDGRPAGLQLFVHPSQEERAKALVEEFENDPECQKIVLEKRAEWMKKRAEAAGRALSRQSE